MLYETIRLLITTKYPQCIIIVNVYSLVCYLRVTICIKLGNTGYNIPHFIQSFRRISVFLARRKDVYSYYLSRESFFMFDRKFEPAKYSVVEINMSSELIEKCVLLTGSN